MSRRKSRAQPHMITEICTRHAQLVTHYSLIMLAPQFIFLILIVAGYVDIIYYRMRHFISPYRPPQHCTTERPYTNFTSFDSSLFCLIRPFDRYRFTYSFSRFFHYHASPFLRHALDVVSSTLYSIMPFASSIALLSGVTTVKTVFTLLEYTLMR